jgi:hypothetical protein
MPETTETRDAVRLPDGRIDCQLNHPIHGWISFTASPDDPELFGRELWASLNEQLG